MHVSATDARRLGIRLPPRTKRGTQPKAVSEPEELFAAHWRMFGGGIPLQREHQFHPGRDWRLDFAHPATHVAVEIDGGQYVRGRHNRPAGYQADCEKLNAAVVLGWSVFRVTPKMLKRDPQGICAIIAQRIGR